MIREVRDVSTFLCAALRLRRTRAPADCGRPGPGSGTLAGAVLDPDGKTVVGAPVVIRNEASGEIRTTITNGAGQFSAANLSAGSYAIELFVPGFETVRRTASPSASGRLEEVAIRLSVANISETVTVSAALPAAAVAAPSQASLTARSAQSLISNEYIRNYTSPVSDYSQVLQMAPGTFSVSANGPGLGDTKTFFRGFKDGQYSMTYDGIPFNDTNDPTHHSWAFFPAQTIGSTVFDRSPGSAATIGPSTYGGSVNLLSRSLDVATSCSTATVSYGSFNTRLFDVDFDTGRFGDDGKSRLMFDVHEMRVGRLSDVQLPEARRVLGEVSVPGQRQHVADRVHVGHALHEQHAEPERVDARADRAVRRQLPDDRRPDVAAVLQVQLLLASRPTSSTSASGRLSATAGRSTTRPTRCATTTSRTTTA